MFKSILSVLALLFVFSPLYAEELPATTMYMYHSDNCGVCVKFFKEVGDTYGDTELSKKIPLEVKNITNGYTMDREYMILARSTDWGYKALVTPMYLFINNNNDELYGLIVGYSDAPSWYKQVTNILALMEMKALETPSGK